ncbi:DUF2726 domain-containing protein [Rhodocaloribacter litoris]|uniref:DUF2726 domain-containing protein n=1 Tax=Rhodocaloribacter litoris TaxID=2558931 RepID=UPI0014228FD9|nr:DUF2726 domain-containing protein [Rhodocaloribacter litoris]QXD17052.1 DUF2726 domain-containing protein [Rhodocaloribacter litoris]
MKTESNLPPDPEAIYRLIYERRWPEVLEVAHRHAPALRDDPLLARAMQTFVTAFFTDREAGTATDELLEKLLLLHRGGFLSLPDAHLDALVVHLVQRHAGNPARALDYARFRPEHPVCAAFLRAHGPPEIETVGHAREDVLEITHTRPFAEADATRSLFRSQQEADFFLAVREVFATYFVYPNVALSSVLDYERLRDRLSGAERRYFFRALIDCVVFDQHAGYRPRYFFELDSPHHDDDARREKDRLKERMLALAGQRLYRIRPRAAPPGRETFVALLKAIPL